MIQKPQFSRWVPKERIATSVLAGILAVLPVAKGDPTAYLATDLVSDQPGVAPILDPHLVNAWGISLSSTSPFWVSSEGGGVSNLYAGDVMTPLMKVPLEVSIPGGHPTGQVFNGTPDFVVSDGNFSGPAIFIFASLTGEVRGWNPNVPPSSTVAQLGYASPGSVYTGITLANNGTANFLYLADFQNGKIDVLDHAFSLVHLAGSFTDPGLPAHYAPFNVAAINGRIYVAYAKRDANGEEVIGAHLGFVSVFETNGNFERRLASRGALNAPWATVFAPTASGDFSGDLLIGNFGDGRINAFDPTTGAYLEALTQSPDHPLEIDGLWG